MNRWVKLLLLGVSIPAVAFAALLIYSVYLDRTASKVPSFLAGVHAEGGYWTSCPIKSSTALERELKKGFEFPPKGNPAIDQRLEALFPAGSPESKLLEFLIKEGFSLDAPCETDLLARSASFSQKRYFLTATDSTVVWKVDDKNKITWIKGDIFYIGL
jgi:hypothetical protein